MLNIIIPIYEPDDLDNKSLEILDSINNKTMFAWSLEHLEKYHEKKKKSGFRAFHKSWYILYTR